MNQGRVKANARTVLLSAALTLALPSLAATAPAPPAPSPGGLAPLAPAQPAAPSPDASIDIRADSVLPPLPTIGLGATDTPLGVLRSVRFFGNSAFDDRALDDVITPFLDRSVFTSDLILLRDQVAAHYQSAGYLATRVSLRRDSLEGGVLLLDVREGTLASVPCVRILKTRAQASARDCEDTTVDAPRRGRLRSGYVLARLPTVQSAPLNIDTLRSSLGGLQRDPRIARLEAAITPNAIGDADLALTVWEASPWRLAGEVSNHVSPSLGEVLGTLEFGHGNLSGWGDSLFATVRVAPGLTTAQGGYSMPLLAGAAQLALLVRGGWSEVVEAPFDALDLTGRTSTFELRVDFPRRRQDPDRSLSYGVALVQRSSSSFIFGDPFAFTDAGDNGAYRLTIVRASQAWLARSRRHALSLRSTFSLGTGLLDATGATQPGTPDRNFFAWRGQAQWARTLRWRGTQLLARADLQLAADPLFSLEAFALGGISSVRGFRENQLIRDSGTSASLEARIPLHANGRHQLALALFTDVGRAWNLGDDDDQALWSVGAGLRWTHRRVNVSLYAGHALSATPAASGNSLQDDGIHLSIRTAR